MRQGDISVLFGCHSLVHVLLVVRAYLYLYGSITWQQCVCILVHDLGHIGCNYLSDLSHKQRHWILGARIARFLFGPQGYCFTAGHCADSNVPRSQLYAADKYSWYIAPRWWLGLNQLFEPRLRMGYSKRWEAVDAFQRQVRESIESGAYRPTHLFFLERCRVNYSGSN